MDVGDHRDPHRRARTLAAPAAAVAAAGVWAAAAVLLLRVETPPLALPALDAGEVFAAGELARAEEYRSLARWLWVASTALQLAALGLLAWRARPLARRAGWWTRGRVRTAVALGLAASLVLWAAALPPGAAAHWWRRRYGLSEQGYAAWLGDRALSLAVTSLLVALAVAAAVALASRFGRRWWIAGGGVLAALAVLFALLQPVLVGPLFNRFEPLRDAALAAGVERAADRLGVELAGVEVADASRRTTAANAQVIGIGPGRRVVLHDTLLDGRFTDGAVLAVAAHELAHVARAHVWKGVAWFALLALPGLAVVAWATERRGGLRDPALVPAGLLVAFVLFVVTLPVQSAISRRYEREADWLALAATRDPQAAEALHAALARANLADPTPPAWSRVLLGTHPTPLERIATARAFAERP